jgi:hypothetical protein
MLKIEIQLNITSAHEYYLSKERRRRFDSSGFKGSYDNYFPLVVICSKLSIALIYLRSFKLKSRESEGGASTNYNYLILSIPIDFICKIHPVISTLNNSGKWKSGNSS